MGSTVKNLGVQLFARSTRALQLTPEGQAFGEQCKGPLAQLDTACKDIASDALNASGKLRATLSSPLAYIYLIPLLPLFFKRYPHIQLELELCEDPTPLISKRFDLGIRVGVLNDAAFVARPLDVQRLPRAAAMLHRRPRHRPTAPAGGTERTEPRPAGQLATAAHARRLATVYPLPKPQTTARQSARVCRFLYGAFCRPSRFKRSRARLMASKFFAATPRYRPTLFIGTNSVI